MNFYYYINEQDSLIFKTIPSRCCHHFELYTKGEDTIEYKLATYENNSWKFDDESRERLFWNMFLQNRQHFQKSFKQYFRTFDERPTVFECAVRRFNIKITKTKNKVTKKFYSLYPTR